MSRRTRQARMAAQASERVPVFEHHVVIPAKIETIACTVHIGADVHVEAPSPPQDEPASPPTPMTLRERARAVAAVVERAMGKRRDRRTFRVVSTPRGLDVQLSEPVASLVVAVRQALARDLPGVATVEGRRTGHPIDQRTIVTTIPPA